MIIRSDYKMWRNFLLWLFLNFPTIWCGFPNVYPTLKTYPLEAGDDPGPPLILTPMIKGGKIQDALKASKVFFNGFLNVDSYSGYFTVDSTHNSNMFFWFFPSLIDFENAPVLLWLQGGPGATSLFGLFAENGPFSVKAKKGLRKRKYAWTNTHSVIYIDNPVGTGYSFTDEDGYAQNETKVGSDLYEALQQFFTLFPALRKNAFYVTGESYAGKYVPAISSAIDRGNQANPNSIINLNGLTIGNGLCDPINQLKYSDYLYQIGLIDANTRQVVLKYEQEGIEYIKQKEFGKAFQIFDTLLNGDLNNHTSLFKNATGFENYFNYLYAKDPWGNESDYMATYIQRPDVRAAIHVGNATFNGGENNQVEVNLVNDIMQSIAPLLTDLLAKYRVLIYNGQLDIIVAYPLTINYLQQLNFPGADQYKTATRKIWMVGDDVAGYVKVAGNLTEILVRDAGHMVPADQPQFAYDMIQRFTDGKPF